jgi:hypothetical protein
MCVVGIEAGGFDLFEHIVIGFLLRLLRSQPVKSQGINFLVSLLSSNAPAVKDVFSLRLF